MKNGTAIKYVKKLKTKEYDYPKFKSCHRVN